MAKYTSDEYQQYHQGDREYCRESGPLNYKAIDFPPVTVRSGLGLLSSALVIVTLILILLPVSLSSRALSVGYTDAVIRVEVRNRPADQPLRYVLTPASDTALTVASGTLKADIQDLPFDGLTPDTPYLITYYIEEGGALRRLGDCRFRTLAEPTEPGTEPTETPTEPTGPSVKPTEPPTEPTEPPTEPTDPPTEPTEPPTEPTDPPTEPTNPPTEPTETPTEPTNPPTEPTDPPTEPTDPPTEPTDPPTEPTDPPTEPTVPVSTPQAQPPQVTGAAAVTDDTGAVTAYRITQVHTFTGVPSENCTVTVTQGGSALADYTAAYDAATETLTVTFTGDPLAPGSSAESRVRITCEDGGTAQSTQTVTAPRLDTLSLEVTAVEGGALTFQMNGTLTQPSVGTLELELLLTPDLNGETGDAALTAPISFTISGPEAAFSQSAELTADAPGVTMTAQVRALVRWSLDDTDTAQTLSAERRFRIPDVSLLTFENVTPEGIGYVYTVHAKFANLTGCTPLSLVLYREEYAWYWGDRYGEQPMTEITDLTIDELGNLHAYWDVGTENVIPREQTGHQWRATLTYLDSDGAEQTAEITGIMEPLSSSFNALYGTMWQSGGLYYIDFTFHTFINPNLSPGTVSLASAHSLGWTLESCQYTQDGDLLTVTGRMSTDSFSAPGIHTYWYWSALPDTETIYSGCGGFCFSSSSCQITAATANADGTGYTDVTEVHRFHSGSQANYYTPQITVTLADGSVITLSPDTTDETGQVTVNWDDGGDITVTITQAQVAAGGSCTVNLTVSDYWYDSGNANITMVTTNHSTLVYPNDLG